MVRHFPVLHFQVVHFQSPPQRATAPQIKQVCVQSTWHYPHLLLSAELRRLCRGTLGAHTTRSATQLLPAVDPYLLPAQHSSANPPRVAAAVEWRHRQTDTGAIHVPGSEYCARSVNNLKQAATRCTALISTAAGFHYWHCPLSCGAGSM